MKSIICYAVAAFLGLTAFANALTGEPYIVDAIGSICWVVLAWWFE